MLLGLSIYTNIIIHKIYLILAEYAAIDNFISNCYCRNEIDISILVIISIVQMIKLPTRGSNLLCQYLSGCKYSPEAEHTLKIVNRGAHSLTTLMIRIITQIIYTPWTFICKIKIKSSSYRRQFTCQIDFMQTTDLLYTQSIWVFFFWELFRTITLCKCAMIDVD